MSGSLDNYEELLNEIDKTDEEFTSYNLINITPKFNFEDENYPQKKAKELLEQAKKETDGNIKLNLLKECLLYNNIDEEIILEFLKTQKEETEKKLLIKKYGYYLSETNYKIYFNKDKKGVIDLDKELFNLFETFKKGS